MVAKQPDIAMVDKQKTNAVVIGEDIPSDSNKKEHENPEKYQELREEQEYVTQKQFAQFQKAWKSVFDMTTFIF